MSDQAHGAGAGRLQDGVRGVDEASQGGDARRRGEIEGDGGVSGVHQVVEGGRPEPGAVQTVRALDLDDVCSGQAEDSARLSILRGDRANASLQREPDGCCHRIEVGTSGA